MRQSKRDREKPRKGESDKKKKIIGTIACACAHISIYLFFMKLHMLNAHTFMNGCRFNELSFMFVFFLFPERGGAFTHRMP